MEPLQLNKFYLKRVNLYPVEKHEDPLTKFKHHTFTVLVVTFECLSFFYSVVFISRNYITNIEKSLHAMLQVAAVGSVIYIWIIGYLQRNKVVETFKYMNTIYNLCNFHSKFNCFNGHKIIN